MQSPFIFTLCLLAAPIVTAQEFFTAPTPGAVLDLSSSAIDIQWNPDNAQYSQLDLKFASDSFSYTLAENISTADGQYTWDPSGVSSALQSTKIELTGGEDYRFEADQHDANSSSGAGVQSGEYAVTGYPYVNAATGMKKLQVGAALLGVASLLVAFAV